MVLFPVLRIQILPKMKKLVRYILSSSAQSTMLAPIVLCTPKKPSQANKVPPQPAGTFRLLLVRAPLEPKDPLLANDPIIATHKFLLP